MGYIDVIKKSFILFPAIAFFFTGFFILRQYHKYGSINKFRTLIVYSFILYLMTIYFLVILPLPSQDVVDGLKTPYCQLIPFKAIYDFLRDTPLVINDFKTYFKAISDSSFYVIVFNILMFVPFGMYLRYYYKCSLKKTILFSFMLSLFFELTQLSGLYFIYSRPYRLFDVDDLIQNTLGGFIGYFIMSRINFLPSRDHIDDVSYRDGRFVSGLRRLVLFVFDISLCLLLYFFVSLLIDYKYLIYIVMFIYFVLIPSIFNGKTIGSKFLNVQFKFSYNLFLGLLFRFLFLYFYYIVLPFVFFWFKFNFVFKGVFILVMFLIIPLFYLINVILLLKGKGMFYDKLLRVEYISTVQK